MKDDTTYKSMVPYYKVAFLGESIACSGFPKKTFYDNDEFKNDSYEEVINDVCDDLSWMPKCSSTR